MATRAWLWRNFTFLKFALLVSFGVCLAVQIPLRPQVQLPSDAMLIAVGPFDISVYKSSTSDAIYQK